MATLFDKLFNRKIKGKLTIEDTDELSSVLKKAVEQADSSEIYVLPDEPTEAQIKEAMNHKFIKNYSDIYVLFEDDTTESPNIHIYYGCVNGADDGIENAVFSIYHLSFEEGHYQSEIFTYDFINLLNFGQSEKGKLLVVDDDGQTTTEDLFTAFTHSLAELDATLRGIVESSITDGEAKPCTQAQWGAIKALLDKSLYFNYTGQSLIKSVSDGVENYVFSGSDLNNQHGASLYFYYNVPDSELTVQFTEI